ncbi:MAG: glycerol-3-phosphate 1-O-acyltransferase PlsY [Clostridia bacterium]|nr:glycerol-3-phosphate 1-O-acyltransferase PlsY [Clostridia bacterium]
MKYLIYAVIGYFVGCLNFGMIVPKIMYKKDIREYGSGNAGATNAFRVFGKIAGVIVLILDMAKSFIYLMVLKQKFDETSLILLAWAGLFVVVGHIYPLFFGFKGGKGVSATGGTIAALCPLAFVPLAIVFVLTILIKKKVGLGSVVAVSMIPFGVLLVNLVTKVPWTVWLPVMVINLVMCVIVVLRHKENIIQMKKDGII